MITGTIIFTMKMPNPLISGSKACICAPSSYAETDLIQKAKKTLEKEGYEVTIPDGLFEQHGQIAGNASHRANLLETALLNDEYDAILFSGGGHRSAELVPILNWLKLSDTRPKIVMGMSDNSAILNSITSRLGWITILGPTLHQVAKKEAQYSAPALSLLAGQTIPLTLDYKGDPISGKVIACTLSLLPLIIANEGLEYFKNSLLCIEDIGEEYSSIDRLMLHAKLSGLFGEGFVNAVILGDFTDMRDNGRPFGFAIEEIVKHHSQRPIATNAPFGHVHQCHPILIGAQGTLSNNQLTF